MMVFLTEFRIATLSIKFQTSLKNLPLAAMDIIM